MTETKSDATGHNPTLAAMRGLACVLLVSYHVIGNTPAAGLKLDYPHGLRLFADFLIDLRMPMFAFIAGYVYALRPVLSGSYFTFLLKKSRRILIPGYIAILMFAILATALGTPFALETQDYWQLLIFPYAHFWYLQAIFLILAVFGLIDNLLGNKKTLILVPIVLLIYLSDLQFGSNGSSIFAVDQAIYLSVFFLTGVIVHRQREWLIAKRKKVLLAASLIIVAASLYNISFYLENGIFSSDRRDLQSLSFGISICILVYYSNFRSVMFQYIGAFSFAIYLYHVFGTSGCRQFLQLVGVDNAYLIFPLGIIAGIALPILLQKMLSALPPIFGQAILGIRPDSHPKAWALPPIFGRLFRLHTSRVG